jgi:hypothetical protein
MPVKVWAGEEMITLRPTTEWQTEDLRGLEPERWEPATDLFFIRVERTGPFPV